MTHISIGPVVRATSPINAIVWGAFSAPCEVTLSALPASPTSAAAAITAREHTVTVGGYHFAAPQLQGLQPGTWYHYQFLSEQGEELIIQETSQPVQCFRTLDDPETLTAQPFVYGSCRKLDNSGTDALSAFGDWLLTRFETRESTWPRFQLFIGDQIYADEPPPALIIRYPQLRDGARTFEDFSHLYSYSWTLNSSTRQALAALPTYMIFDDHEVDNNWNCVPGWEMAMVQTGKEQTIVDGLVAYWVYQGWGNISDRSSQQHPLLHVMEQAAQSGVDALEELRACIRQTLNGGQTLRWHYELPTTPPIFVSNARTERTQALSEQAEMVYAPSRIMSEQQMDDLRAWTQLHDSGPAILVSSVPILLPPLIGLAEYVTGIRPLWHSVAPLHWLSRQLARFQMRLSHRFSFDHWPLYTLSWRALLRLLKKRRNDLVVLSGDVHFSYALDAHPIFTCSHAHLYQLVSTPIQNRLGANDLRMIQLQAPFKRLFYGGLASRILPLRSADSQARIPRDILLQNTLAYVTVQARQDKHAHIDQKYLGIVNGHLAVIAQTILR